MDILKLGSHGPKVLSLQQMLIGKDWLSASVNGFAQADDVFGPNTLLAVKNFQKANNLIVDGKVGDITWNALALGSIFTEPGIPAGAPAIPTSYQEVEKTFGATEDEIESNLAFCEVPPSLKAFDFKGHTGKRGFTCHKLLVNNFGAVFSEIAARGLSQEIYSYDGCFNWRKVTGGTLRSLHSYAIAIDIDYNGNELGNTHPTIDLGVVKIFKQYGFFWGGDFKSRKDPMHFEYFRYS